MLRDESIDLEDTTWGYDGHDGRDDTERDWQAIDRDLCDVAKRRGALDGQEVFVRAGIYTPDGELTEPYRSTEPSASRPTD